MKNPVIIFLFSLSLIFVQRLEAQVFNIPSDVYAEITKTEKKEWKKSAKDYKRNPRALKVLTKEHSFYRNEATNLKAQIELKNQVINSLETEINGFEEQVSSLEKEVNKLKMESGVIADTQENILDLSGAAEKGIVFKLQVGSFEKVNLPYDKGDVQKILLGKFRDYSQAKKLQGYLKEMGIDGAWIVSYKDGKRIPIEDAIHIKP